MLKNAKRTIIIFIMATFIAGCANSPVVNNANGQTMATQKQKSFFELSPSDADMIQEALSYLNNPEGKPDYNAAKAKLAILIQEYPKSKWTASAQVLIQTINHLLALQEKVKFKSLALDKANTEKAKLRKDYKSAEERYQAETVKLQQENEQLKNDISLLKKLEIQMDKREKMLK
ncbi:MAG: hypothetical protein AB2L12_06760 [Smithellaceae bacterium]